MQPSFGILGMLLLYGKGREEAMERLRKEIDKAAKGDSITFTAGLMLSSRTYLKTWECKLKSDLSTNTSPLP